MKAWNLTLPVALLLAFALLGIGAAVTIYAEREQSAQSTQELHMEAQILAAIVPAALAFDDRKAALEYINGLRQNPSIRVAAFYDDRGNLFTGFSLSDTWTIPAHVVMTGEPRREGDHIVLTVPVMQEGARLGTVLLRAVTEPIASRMARYGGIMLLFVMGALVLVVIGMANKAQRNANRELADRADRLSQAYLELSEQAEQRERAEAALRHAQKMETIGQLTGGVAHDFNNLLTIVIGSLERLQRRLADRRDAGELGSFVDNAMRGAERAAGLTQSLLAFARKQPLKPAPVDVNRLVANISNILLRTLGEKIAIESVLGAGLWKAVVDANQLENTILNLAVNARDAMPDGGKLTIETANAYLDRDYADRYEEVTPGQYVMLAMSDTGVGMTAEVAERAFEPFFTTKEVGQGTGLGLSQVYGFVKQSGGHVKIYTDVGAGTTVKIYLPRLVGEEKQRERAQVEAPMVRGDRGTLVLIVEDEEEVRALTAGIVEELGYTVLEASDGPEALRILEQYPGINVLFTDVGLPSAMNGRQLADAAVSLRPNLKVLFTTGYARNAIVHEGRLDPGVHLITKPFTYANVGRALSDLLRSQHDPSRVLVVEDEYIIMINTVEQLQQLGFRVIEAATAEEALAAFRDAEPKPAAALVDIGLPDKKGDALALELRALDGDLLIVIASGQHGDEVRERFAADAKVRFLDKPYNLDSLSAALRG